jgi:hypothetical protein
MYHLTSKQRRSKYNHTKHFFKNSYPWLFPDGVGDIYNLERGEIPKKEWGRHLLQYYDGQFLEDPLFGLFLYLLVGQGRYRDPISSTLKIIIRPPQQPPAPFLRAPLCSALPN